MRVGVRVRVHVRYFVFIYMIALKIPLERPDKLLTSDHIHIMGPLPMIH